MMMSAQKNRSILLLASKCPLGLSVDDQEAEDICVVAARAVRSTFVSG